LTVGLDSLANSLRPPSPIRPFPNSPSPIRLVPGPSIQPQRRVLLAPLAPIRVTEEESWCLVVMELALVSRISRWDMPVPQLEVQGWCLVHPRYTLFFHRIRGSSDPGIGLLWVLCGQRAHLFTVVTSPGSINPRWPFSSSTRIDRPFDVIYGPMDIALSDFQPLRLLLSPPFWPRGG